MTRQDDLNAALIKMQNLTKRRNALVTEINNNQIELSKLDIAIAELDALIKSLE